MIDPNQPQGDFIKKPIEQPFLDSSLRRQLSQSDISGKDSPINPAAGQAGFFKQNKYYILAIIVGLAIISVLAYLVFRKSPQQLPKEANLNISIDVPETLPSGSDALYKINIANQDTQKLTNIVLELAYPEGFTYIFGSPKARNLSGTLFEIPDLISGQSAALFVKVKTSGAVNEEKKLQAKVHYNFSNFSSEFVKTREITVRLVASDILFELSGPSEANTAQLVVFNVKYQNNSGQDIKNARIKINYPEGFEFASAQPPPDIGQDGWNIDSLAKGGSGAINLQGNFRSSAPGESKTTTAQFLILGSNGQFAEQNNSSFATKMAVLPLIVSQQLAADHPSQTVNPGDTLIISVDYQNNNTTAATGVNIIASLDPKILDLSTLRAEGGQVSGSTISWNAASMSQLENLSPSETGHLAFQVRLNNPATRDAAKNLSFVSNIKIKSSEYESYFPGNVLNLKVSSPASLNTQLSYVSGAMPPQAGKATVYKVKLSLVNSSNDFSDGILTLFIPLGSGGYEGGVNIAEKDKVDFDQTTSKLTWNFGQLPAYTGKFTQARVLEFNVRLNPSSSQANSSPVLVKDIQMAAKDNFTGQDINVSADDLTAADISGSGGYGNGFVQP